MDIHSTINNKYNLFHNLTQASAISLAKRISDISSTLIFGQQEDPTEFLVILLDHMMKCLSSIHLSSFDKYMSSPLHLIFGYNLKSSIKCTLCLNETIKENYESLLPIPIVGYSNLHVALAAFFSQTQLDGDNSFACLKCKKQTTALKSLHLVNVSPVVFIHLKRFVYDQNANIIRKLTHFVSCPEYLDLMPYSDKDVFQSNEHDLQLNKLIYQLYGVLIHLGDTAHSGHISTYIRSPDDAWYTANDEKILPTNLKHVLADNNSYLLCYVKLPEEKINFFVTGDINSSSRPSQVLLSSTPIRAHERTNESVNSYSPVRKKLFPTKSLSYLLFCGFRPIRYPISLILMMIHLPTLQEEAIWFQTHIYQV
jgi:ubiquitin C-terminal hydrolase